MCLLEHCQQLKLLLEVKKLEAAQADDSKVQLGGSMYLMTMVIKDDQALVI